MGKDRLLSEGREEVNSSKKSCRARCLGALGLSKLEDTNLSTHNCTQSRTIS